jgi:hypothetical protein
MALQASGPISFSQIANEFGLSPGRNLGAYRISQSVGTLSNLPLDSGIPQSGSISFSNFYGKRLNMVTDLFSIPQNSSRRVARNRYNNNFVIVIGGFRSRPSSSSGTKVYINVNQRIGSEKGNIFNVALKTGSWDSTTNLEIVVGPNGSLMGAGGDGGTGTTGRGGDATSGTSALGVQYSTTIINQGLIFGGRGGGGGGGGATFRRCGKNQRGCKGGSTSTLTGGGGAGGRGFPAGGGGGGGNAGSSGTIDSNGSGGAGQFGQGSSAGYSGTSGAGGSIESSGGSGSPGSGGGSGGSRGYAIIVSPGASAPYSGSGTLGGSIVTGTPT